MIDAVAGRATTVDARHVRGFSRCDASPPVSLYRLLSVSDVESLPQKRGPSDARGQMSHELPSEHDLVSAMSWLRRFAARCIGARLQRRVDPADLVSDVILRLTRADRHLLVTSRESVRTQLLHHAIDLARRAEREERCAVASFDRYGCASPETSRLSLEFRERIARFAPVRVDQLILRLLLRDMNATEIARRLHLTPATVRQRLCRLRIRAGAPPPRLTYRSATSKLDSRSVRPSSLP